MKIKSFFICFILLISFKTLTAKQPSAYLLTYPRSGTHWIRFCINYIMKKDETFYPSLVSGVHHFHSFEIMEEYLGKPWKKIVNKDKDFLILVIRDYKESMLRHFFDNPEAVILHLKDDSRGQKQLKFFNNLDHFDQWPSDRRLLVYYENFLSDPRKELNQIAKFLRLKKNNISSLMRNLSKFKQEMINSYNDMHQTGPLKIIGSQSEGKDFHYHQKKVSIDSIKRMEKTARNRSPKLYDKYLKRYEYSTR